jgi:HEPN domain-containing protein
LSPEHKEVAALLLRKARGDLQAARTLVATEGHASHTIGFLTQQAVEKSLKAVLAAREIEIPHTHDIERLLQILGPETELDKSLAGSGWLTPWGVDFRYDEDDDDLDRDSALEAATAAVALAEQTLAGED